jgi:hypothetical protein
MINNISVKSKRESDSQFKCVSFPITLDSKKYKYSFKVVTHLNLEPRTVVCENRAVLKKVSYISGQLRQFKALCLLPDAKLFNSILSPPFPEKSERFNPKVPANPAYLVKRVHVSP